MSTRKNINPEKQNCQPLFFSSDVSSETYMDDDTRAKYGVMSIADSKVLEQAAKIADSPTYWARFDKKIQIEQCKFICFFPNAQLSVFLN